MSMATQQLELERRISIIEDILDISADAPCSAHNVLCGGPCDTPSCARATNRLTDLGSLVGTLIHEFRWYRAWAEELEAAKVVPSGTVERVELRVRRALLMETVLEAESGREQVKDFPGIAASLDHRIQELRTRIEQIDKTLTGA